LIIVKSIVKKSGKNKHMGKPIKGFTELTLDGTKEGYIARYLDEGCSDENLIERFGATTVVYGLIATNRALSHKISYEEVYPLLLAFKPKTQEMFDTIFDELKTSLEEEVEIVMIPRSVAFSIVDRFYGSDYPMSRKTFDDAAKDLGY